MRLRPICLPPGFETAAIAEQRRDRLIEVLRRDPQRFAAQIDLLEECGRGSECHQRICDPCMRKARVQLVNEGLAHFGPMVRSGKLIAVSVVLANEALTLTKAHLNSGSCDHG